MIKIIRVTGYVVLSGGVLVILVGYLGIWMSDGFFAVLELMNPWNIINFITTVAVIVPGTILLLVADKMEKSKISLETDSLSNNEITEKQYEKGKQIVVQTQKVSTALVQRHVGLSYEKAKRIIDMLEERGVIGPENGAIPREIL